MRKVILKNRNEQILIRWDDTRFSLTQEQTTQMKTIVLNPREAQEIADFINENNTEYKRELQEKKLLENQEHLS